MLCRLPFGSATVLGVCLRCLKMHSSLQQSQYGKQLFVIRDVFINTKVNSQKNNSSISHVISG